MRPGPPPVETDHPGNPDTERTRTQAPVRGFQVLFETFPLKHRSH